MFFFGTRCSNMRLEAHFRTNIRSLIKMLPPLFCNSSLARASINNLGKFSCLIAVLFVLSSKICYSH